MRRRRRFLLLSALLIALTTGACGGEDNDDPVGEQQASQIDADTKAHNDEIAEQALSDSPSEDEKDAKRTATRFYAILADERASRDPNRTTVDSTAFCELMGDRAMAQTIHYAEVSSGIARQWDCEKAVELLVIRSKRAGGFRHPQQARVIGVNAEGDRATATVRSGKGPVTSISLVKEDGEWKLGASFTRDGS